MGGVTFAQLAPPELGNGEGDSIISGQGALARLDGTIAPGRTLFVDMGGDANALSGGSRAAQFMLLDAGDRRGAPARSAAPER